jgi:hypothetical protein
MRGTKKEIKAKTEIEQRQEKLSSALVNRIDNEAAPA